jgi:GNAT superfamily N-acetyltransferase
MKITELTSEHDPSFFLCLEDWSDQAREAGNRRELWYRKMKDRGLRVKLALDDKGIPGGMIQYLPIEYSTAQGEGLYFVNCIWVHGYRQGRGNYQKKGMGEALLKAAEEDAKTLGAKGLAAWGLVLPFWMKASWYRKHGYRNADRDGIMGLVWKPFASEAKPPKWIRMVKKPGKTPGVVTVTSFISGWCMAYNLACERAKRAAGEFGSRVVYNEVDTSERSNLLEWGISDSIFINGEEIRTGPPPSYEKIYQAIERRVKKL